MTTDANSFHIYVDETSKSSDYFGVGAIFCRRDAADEIAGYMSRAVLDHKQRADKEFHWTELKGHLLPLYTEVGCKLICFGQKPKPKMRYPALMVESRRVDRTIDEDANREDILAKFIFTLAYFFVKEFGQNIDYRVFIDSPDGEEGASVAIQCMLNNRCKSKLGFANRPFKQVTYVRSEKSRLIQAVDLITGAIAYETNGLHRVANASKHRQRLWADMLAASKLSSFAVPTEFWPKLFQIQHFDFEKSVVDPRS
jgi:hypothetical protein